MYFSILRCRHRCRLPTTKTQNTANPAVDNGLILDTCINGVGNRLHERANDCKTGLPPQIHTQLKLCRGTPTDHNKQQSVVVSQGVNVLRYSTPYTPIEYGTSKKIYYNLSDTTVTQPKKIYLRTAFVNTYLLFNITTLGLDTVSILEMSKF